MIRDWQTDYRGTLAREREAALSRTEARVLWQALQAARGQRQRVDLDWIDAGRVERKLAALARG